MRHAVIMAGGAGSRFWPRSRERRPKQLLAITGGQSLLRRTFERLAALVEPSNIWLVTSDELAAQCRAELPELAAQRVLCEPLRRNTAPCVGLAALAAAAADPQAVLGVFPADHLIADPAGFAAAAQAAYATAESGDVLVTLGVRPFFAATGYGYIGFGQELTRCAGQPVHEVERFIEKPQREAAQRLLEQGNNFWNAGIFFFSAKAILAAIGRYMPRLAVDLTELDRVAKAQGYGAAAAALYPQIEPQSIDVGVMERADNLRGIPADMGWSDVGAWTALEELLPKDEQGNAAVGRLLALDSRGCIVHAPGQLVALIGVEDLIVVPTDDALLVCHKSRAQEIKRLYDELKQRGWKEYL